MHAAEDQDWFQWTAPSRGTCNVSIFFDHREGDLELQVYDANQRRVAWSSSSTDDEHISLPAVAGQTFFLRVFAADGVTRPRYDLLTDLGPEQPYVYVASEAGLDYYDLQGNHRGAFDASPLTDGVMGDVEMGPNGLIYLAVGTRTPGVPQGAILEFTPSGTLSKTIALPDDTNERAIPYPMGFDVLVDGSLLVPQPNRGRILRVFRDGSFQDITPAQGVTAPVDVAVTSYGQLVWSEFEAGELLINAARDGSYWLARANSVGWLLYDAAGTPIGSLPALQGSTPVEAQELPDGTRVAVSAAGPGQGRLERFDPSGNRLDPIDLQGTPSGLAILWVEKPSRVPLPDQDGDGLLDLWEQQGLDVDGDGIIDLDLPALGRMISTTTCL